MSNLKSSQFIYVCLIATLIHLTWFGLAWASSFTISPIFDNLSILVSSPSLNNRGQIAYVGSKESMSNRGDIYFYDGTTLTNITTKLDQSAYSPILNNKGQIAFRTLAGEGRYEIYFYNGTSLTKISDAAKIFIHPGNYYYLTFNNAGQIAFIGSNLINDSSDLYFYDGSTIHNITSDLNIIVSAPDLNDKGEIAFIGDNNVLAAYPSDESSSNDFCTETNPHR
ncbi:MAG: hypothetical protein A3G93_04540 [Nitrospinae bacterium RIFCSPLOWO2_12_FULL_45_22]|nr:MAG: hypothetical protein A3G93_04540 [Nitrospinae bacterium RIFCSPLOWO2_12_FULL_45_22]